MEKLSTSPPSPLSPTLWPADAFSIRRCLIFIAALALALVVGLAAAALIVGLATPVAERSSHPRLTAGGLIGYVALYAALLGVVLPLLPFVARRSLRDIGLHPPEFRDLGFGLLGGIAMWVVAEGAALAQKFLLHLEGTQTAVQLFGTTHDRTLIYGLVTLAVVVAPFVEELIFRGFLFNALLRYAPIGLAAVGSGILFGLAHFDKESAAACFPIACGGVVLAVVYYRSGSLVSSMFTHGLFNAINITVLLATGGKG